MRESATLTSGSPPNLGSVDARSTLSMACLATRSEIYDHVFAALLNKFECFAVSLPPPKFCLVCKKVREIIELSEVQRVLILVRPGGVFHRNEFSIKLTIF